MTSNKPSLDDLRIDRRAGSSGPTRRWLWVTLLLSVAVLCGGVWWWVARPEAATVRVAAVRESSGAEGGAVLNASGYVTARRRATVSSKVTGKVVDVLVEEGMKVREGQLLARLDDTSARAHLNLAQAQLAAAQRMVTETDVRLQEARLTLERTRQLVKEGVSGQASLDTAQAEVDSLIARLAVGHQQVTVAEQQLAVRRTELDDTVIRAPFAGVAISKDAQPGEMVSPISAGGGFTRTGISTIVDMASLEIEVDVNESYINRVTPGQQVVAVLDAYPDWRIPSRVITTIPAADRQKATVLVRIAFEKLDPRILPDMGVKVTFLAEPEPGKGPSVRLFIPRSAVRTEETTQVAYVLRSDRVERRAIRLGASDADQVEVVAGLSAGEQVVVDGPTTLKDGDRVLLNDK